MKQKDKWDSSNPANGMVSYLERLFPVCLQVMQQTEQNFDLDKDGMIENSGFPDQVR